MKLRKIAAMILVLALGVSMLFGCGNSTAEKTDEETTENKETTESTEVTFKDDLDREVTVDQPEKVAALLGSYADVWMLAGGEVCATADDAWNDFNLDLPEDCVNLGETKALDLELLLASEPDLVIASTNTSQHVEWLETFENAGITVAYFDASTFESYLNMLKICTDITGKPELYEKYGTDLMPVIEAARESAKERNDKDGAPTVLVMRASTSFIRVKNSEDNVIGEILKDLGAINIADSDSSLLENLNVEAILSADPDKIFIVQSGDDYEGMMANLDTFFKDNPAWNDLSAVKSGQVYYMDKMLYNFKPNARWGEAYEGLDEVLAK